MTAPYRMHTDERGTMLHTDLTPQQERDRQLARLERYVWGRWLAGFWLFVLLLVAVCALVAWLCWPKGGEGSGEGVSQHARRVRAVSGLVHGGSVAGVQRKGEI